jgi:hypothetical protein
MIQKTEHPKMKGLIPLAATVAMMGAACLSSAAQAEDAKALQSPDTVVPIEDFESKVFYTNITSKDGAFPDG